jgi:hypothetical protein
LEELIEYIAKSLVDDPTAVKVRRRDTGGTVILELRVGQGDAGRIIGKNGRVANAVRALLSVAESSSKGKRVVLKII